MIGITAEMYGLRVPPASKSKWRRPSRRWGRPRRISVAA